MKNGLAALPLAALSDAAAAVPSHVIDTHTHFYDTRRPQGVPWPSKGEAALYKPTYPDRYLASVKPFRVDGVVAIEASPWLEDNLWLLRVADENPMIGAVMGNIRPGHPDFREALDRFSKHPLFRGIRINAGVVPGVVAGGQATADLRLLGGRGLTLDILLEGPPVIPEVARLAALLPKLRIVLEHLPLDPSGDEAKRAKDKDEFHALGRFPNVYAKVSGVVRRDGGQVRTDVGFYRPALDELWEIFGPDRTLYGSNWPKCDLIAPYPVVFRIVRDYLATKNSEEATEKYFWKNALEVYKWRDRIRNQ